MASAKNPKVMSARLAGRNTAPGLVPATGPARCGVCPLSRIYLLPNWLKVFFVILVCSFTIAIPSAMAQNGLGVEVIAQVREMLIRKHIDKPSAQLLDGGAWRGAQEAGISAQGSQPTFDSLARALQGSGSSSGADAKAGEQVVRRMVEAIGDPYSSFLSSDDVTRDLEAQRTGRFTGIGVELAWKGGLMVVSSIEGSPARAAGIRPGDLIVAVDNRPVKGLSFYRAGDLLTGAEGSKAVVDVVRKGKPVRIPVVRRRLALPGVSAKMVNQSVGLIRVGYFGSQTGREVAGALQKLKAQGARAIALDLRGNPGGDFRQGLGVATLFCQGKLVLLQTREGNKWMSSSAAPAFAGRVAVLVDHGTASSSEIVAQSMQGMSNVRIVGQRTFGKALVQTLYSVPGGGGLRITTGRYYGRNGKSVNPEGLKPDLAVSDNQDALACIITWLGASAR